MYVGTDALLFNNQGLAATLFNDSGDAVTYDLDPVPGGESGTLTAGQSASITTPVWVRSAGRSQAHVEFSSVSSGVQLTGADATGLADSTTAFRDAHARALAAGTSVIIPPGTYTVSGRIHGTAATTSAVRFMAAVPGTVTIQRSAAVQIIDVAGSKSETIAVSADVTQGSASITVASLPVAGLAADNHIELNSTVLFATGTGSTAATVAEIVKVKTVTGSGPYTINLYGQTEEAYTIANGGTIARVDFAGVSSYIAGIAFRQTAQNRDSASFPLVSFVNARAVTIDSCRFRDADVPGIEMKGTINADIDGCHFENLTDNLGSNFIGYGVNLGGNCRDIRITRPVGRWVRHVVTTGWGTGDVGVPRHILVSHGQGWETSSGAWNTHKEGKFITFDSCEAHHDKNNSFYIRSKNTTLINPVSINCGTTLKEQIQIAELEADDCLIVGGRVVGGANTSQAIVTTAPRTHIIGTHCLGNANGNLIKVDTGANDCVIEDVYCQNPTANGHISVSTGVTGCVVKNGHYISGSLKAVTQATTAGQVRFVGSATGTNVFQIDQNQRALTDEQPTVQTKSGNYTLIDQDGLVFFDATSAGRTATLPTPTAAHVGRTHTIIKKDASANTVTIAVAGGSLFGTSSLTTQGQKVRVVSDGSNWFSS